MAQRGAPNGAHRTTLIRVPTPAERPPPGSAEVRPWGRRTTPGRARMAPRDKARTPTASGEARWSRRATSGLRRNTPQPRTEQPAAFRIPRAARLSRPMAPTAVPPQARQPAAICTQVKMAMCTRTPMAAGKNTITVHGLRSTNRRRLYRLLASKRRNQLSHSAPRRRQAAIPRNPRPVQWRISNNALPLLPVESPLRPPSSNAPPLLQVGMRRPPGQMRNRISSNARRKRRSPSKEPLADKRDRATLAGGHMDS